MKTFKQILKEAVSVQALDAALNSYKQKFDVDPVGSKDYVDMLEFTTDWLANRTTASDADFKDFIKKVQKTYKDPSAVKKVSGKRKKEKDIETDKPKEEPKIEPEKEKETKPKPPPMPKTKKPAKEKSIKQDNPQLIKPLPIKSSYGQPKNMPSLADLAKQEKERK